MTRFFSVLPALCMGLLSGAAAAAQANYTMDPAHASALIGPRTAAILMVHLSSSIADVDAFTSLAERHHLALLEDCSQAHGAVWRGRRVGAFGRAAAMTLR